MAISRPESYPLAVATLRDRLRNGILRPGERITVSDIADALQLSATPVGHGAEPAQEIHLLQLWRQGAHNLF